MNNWIKVIISGKQFTNHSILWECAHMCMIMTHSFMECEWMRMGRWLTMIAEWGAREASSHSARVSSALRKCELDKQDVDVWAMP